VCVVSELSYLLVDEIEVSVSLTRLIKTIHIICRRKTLNCTY